jgi:hypothetical protein
VGDPKRFRVDLVVRDPEEIYKDESTCYLKGIKSLSSYN